MKFIQHYSGSSGNFYEVVADNGKRLLIDPGVRWVQIQRALKYKLGDIEGCLASHSHADHCQSLGAVRKQGIDVYASSATMEAANITGRRAFVVRPRDLVTRMETFGVYCFETIHDCEGSLGFVVREKATGEFLLFATDTKTIRQKFPHPFTIIAIECSYNGEYLAKKVREGTINESLAKRLLTSHMEETECLRYLQEFCNLSHCRVIHLLHLSADHINKKRIIKQFQEELFIKVVTI